MKITSIKRYPAFSSRIISYRINFKNHEIEARIVDRDKQINLELFGEMGLDEINFITSNTHSLIDTCRLINNDRAFQTCGDSMEIKYLEIDGMDKAIRIESINTIKPVTVRKDISDYIKTIDNTIISMVIKIGKVPTPDTYIIDPTINMTAEKKRDYWKPKISAQQGDAPEPATNATSASQPSIPPAR